MRTVLAPIDEIDKLEMRNILVDISSHLGFLSNPKVACTSIKESMLGFKSGKEVHKRIYFDYPTNSDIELFGLTRHPYTRALSCFNNKIGPNKDDNVWLAFCKRHRLDPSKKISFDEYLDILLSKSTWIGEDPHVRPQVLNLHSRFIKPTFIGRLEKMDEVIQYLSAHGINYEAGGQRTQSNKSVEELTSEQKNKLKKLYKKDFSEFGYTESVNIDDIPASIHQKQRVSWAYQLMFLLFKLFRRPILRAELKRHQSTKPAFKFVAKDKSQSADIYRDVGLLMESTGNLAQAEYYFQLAHQARPSGEFIKKKLLQTKRINSVLRGLD
ncbi:sulfotransferase family 2 domain-containing protein [Ferrimonas marina]|uniref:Sulfotransferase family protein n=1 Tax=Ferrimonas marina TaxID=299255 RepID=A0A1M5Y1P1_9GAMM|nr:sulfotransferase family 2 domain-containing protein [Ferrimonas marina]SHI05423.1 Sulfotransferase family protein [Ferrimonas marina]